MLRDDERVSHALSASEDSTTYPGDVAVTGGSVEEAKSAACSSFEARVTATHKTPIASVPPRALKACVRTHPHRQ